MSRIFATDLLKGTAAFITGGGTGLGLGIATALAQCGADVCIASRSDDHLRPAADALREFGGGVLALPTDVRDPDSLRASVEQTVERFGRLDVLVNNAAGNFYAPSATLSPNGWRAVIETDLYGTFFGCQAVYSHLVAQGGGTIISISMTLHYRGWPRMAHATAAKAGVDALTRTLALEWAADGIRVNAVAPGPILTEGVRKAFEVGTDRHGSDRFSAHVPLPQEGTPADIGNMVAYLASPAAAWITGAVMVVDGGSSLSST